MIDILRKQRNFKYNTNADINTGQLIVSKRPTTSFKTQRILLLVLSAKEFLLKLLYDIIQKGV